MDLRHGSGPANTVSHQLPGQQSEGLLVIKQISQANFVVHDRLQTFYTFQLNSIPLGVTEMIKLNINPRHGLQLELTF